MIGAIPSSAERLELAGARFAQALRLTAQILDQELVPRMGFRGMVAAALPVLALAEALAPLPAFLGGARIPLLWCGILYFVLRFPFRKSVEAIVFGSALAWLGRGQSFAADAIVLLAVALAFALLRPWLYTEFWPAHAFAAAAFALVLPGAAWLGGTL
ncbi:MAG: hypothetical protein JXR77_00190, partial [Lentisphaeria bacterium]|nr:hypothetical protein [Lentisphaeria bacterium]